MYVVRKRINTMESTFNTIDQELLAETLILVLAPVIVGFFSLVSISIFWNWGTTKWRSLLQIPNKKKTMYVKLSVTKKLNGNQGRKTKGIISQSGVKDIELQRKIEEPN